MIPVIFEFTGSRIFLAMRRSSPLSDTILDTLSVSMAVIDQQGIIQKVNRAWTQFYNENKGKPVKDFTGVNYLEVCRNASGPSSLEGPHAYEGLKAVLSGKKQEFRMEYPCHSPDQYRWFRMRATPLSEGPEMVVIWHEDISETKQLETLLWNELLTTHEDQRKRTSTLLHEEIAQQLSGILFKLESLDSEALKDSENTLKATIAQLTRLSRSISPQLIEGLGLKPALKDLTQQHFPHRSVSLNIQQVEDLPKTLLLFIYRIIEDLYSSSTPQQGAEAVSIDIRRISEELQLEYRGPSLINSGENDIPSSYALTLLKALNASHSFQQDKKSTKAVIRIPLFHVPDRSAFPFEEMTG